MQEASENPSNSGSVSILVAQQIEEMENLEKYWNDLIASTAHTQKEEYKNFIFNFYSIEKARQEENQALIAQGFAPLEPNLNLDSIGNSTSLKKKVPLIKKKAVPSTT